MLDGHLTVNEIFFDRELTLLHFAPVPEDPWSLNMIIHTHKHIYFCHSIVGRELYTQESN